MDIAYCINDLYVKYMLISIISLIENTNNKSDLQIHILDAGIKPKNKNDIAIFLAKHAIKYFFYDISDKLQAFKGNVGMFHISVCGRLLLPSLLNQYKKIIYLDSDTIINSDIAELWNLNIDDVYLAAVSENLFSQIRPKFYDISYFNSGVLIINLEKIRSLHDIENKFIDYIRANSCTYPDQDCLNKLLGSRILYISPKFNYAECNVEYSAKYDKNILMDAMDNPSIIHYINKPWKKPLKYNLHREKYWYYLNKSHYANYYSRFIERCILWQKRNLDKYHVIFHRIKYLINFFYIIIISYCISYFRVKFISKTILNRIILAHNIVILNYKILNMEDTIIKILLLIAKKIFYEMHQQVSIFKVINSRLHIILNLTSCLTLKENTILAKINHIYLRGKPEIMIENGLRTIFLPLKIKDQVFAIFKLEATYDRLQYTVDQLLVIADKIAFAIENI